MASNWTLADLTIFKERVDNRLREWIQNLSSVEVNDALENLELHTNGTLFERANRLLRRLHGNYTATDFVQEGDSEEDIARRDELCLTFVQSSNFPADLRNAVLTIIDAEEALEDSLQDEAQLPSSSPNEHNKSEDMSLTMTVDSRRYVRDEQNLIDFGPPQESVPYTANSTHSFAPSHAATAVVTTTVTTVPTCAHYSSSTRAQARAASTALRSTPLIRQNTNIPSVRTVLPSGEVHLLPATVAAELQRCWIAEHQLQNYISKQSEEVQVLSSKVLGLERIASDLQKQLQNVVSNVQQQAAEEALRSKTNRSTKNVQFQDTFDLNYFDDPNKHYNSHCNETKLLNAHAPIFHSTTKACHQCATMTSNAPLFTSFGVSAPQLPTVHVPATTVCTQPVCSSWEGGTWPRSTMKPLSQPNPPAANQPTEVTPSDTLSTTNTPRRENKNLGRTVREWKLKFSGDRGVSIEEFLEEVEENKRLDKLTDEELLDSLAPMFEKPARFWYRTLRPSWKTYQDFKRSALKNYSRTKRNKRSLTVEAFLRTQGAEEPVRDYIAALSTILSRFEEPWDFEEQVNLIVDNMLPKLKKKMKCHLGKLTNAQELVDRAQEAEDDEEGQWNPPPPVNQTVLPEVAYKPNKAAKAKAASIASMNAKSPSLSDADLEKKFEKFFQKKTRELTSPSGKATGNNSPGKKAPSTDTETPPKQETSNNNQDSTRGGSRAKGGKRGKGGWRRGGNRSEEVTPKSDKNKDNAVGPSGDKVLCWNCSWPGYTKSTCPECSKDQPKNEDESD